jgi:hypothetical protein
VLTVKYYVETGGTIMTPSKTLIRFPTHHVHVQVKEDQIHIFKFNNHGCDFEVFSSEDSLTASDYIIEPMPQIHYQVTVHEDH